MHDAVPDDPLDRHVGVTFKGRYRLVEKIGEGGMAEVYRAVQPDGPDVAVKVVQPHAGSTRLMVNELASRFLREAAAISHLHHPHIVRMLDFGRADEDTSFLVMELLRGQPLADLLDAGIAPFRVAHLGRQIAAALAYAHERGITHRDLKPENVMVAERPTGEHVTVMDFGVARLRQARGGRKITGGGRMMGTPQYMSPEHLDAAQAGPASDLYSLGVMLFEMLSGRLPFDGTEYMDIVVQHLHSAPPPLTIMGVEQDDFVAPWRELVGRLLEKDPTKRPESAAAVAATLDHILAAMPVPASGKGERRTRESTLVLTAIRRPPPRRLVQWTLATLAIVALISFVVYVLIDTAT